MKSEQSASVHRFWDLAAINFESVPHTVYLTPGMARELAAAITAVADDVDVSRFSMSTLPVVSIAEPVQATSRPPLEEPPLSLILADLIDWAASMGGFEAEVWDRASKALERTRAIAC